MDEEWKEGSYDASHSNYSPASSLGR